MPFQFSRNEKYTTVKASDQAAVKSLKKKRAKIDKIKNRFIAYIKSWLFRTYRLTNDVMTKTKFGLIVFG